MIREGLAEGGEDPAAVPVYPSETAALESELAGAGGAARTAGRVRRAARRRAVLPRGARGVFALLERLGARQVDATTDGMAELSPRLADQRRA